MNPRHMPVVQMPVVAVQGAAPRALRRALGKVGVPRGRSQVGMLVLSLAYCPQLRAVWP